MKAVYKNELSTYFTTLTGFVFSAFLLLFAGIYTMIICLKQQRTEFEYVMGNICFVFFIIVPVLTMRVLAEERRQKTDQLLYSLPISTTEVVLGKYLALLTAFLVPVAVISLYPLILSLYGNLNLMGCYLSILAFFFLGAAFLAIGMFVSSITESQALAAGLCFIILLVNYFLTIITGYITSKAVVSFVGLLAAAVILALIIYLMTKNFYAGAGSLIVLAAVIFITFLNNRDSYSGLLPKLLNELALFDRFYRFMSGSFSLTDIVFFISVAAIFVFLSVQSMEKRRWS